MKAFHPLTPTLLRVAHNTGRGGLLISAIHCKKYIYTHTIAIWRHLCHRKGKGALFINQRIDADDEDDKMMLMLMTMIYRVNYMREDSMGGGIYSSRQPFWFGCRLVFSNLNWWLLFLDCILNHQNWWHFFGTGSTTHYCYSLFESLWSQLMIAFWYLGILELKCSCIMTHDGGIFCLDTAISKIPHNIKSYYLE